MRFVQVIYRYSTGGAEKQVFLTARSLVQAGHPCTVFSMAPGDGSTRLQAWLHRASQEGVRIAPAPRGHREHAANVWALWREVRAPGSVALWSWGSRAELLCKAMALLSRRVKLVCSLRSADPVWIRANTRVLRFASRRVHCCVSNSQRALDIARELLVQRMPPGFVLHNALEDPFPEAAPIPRPDRILRVAMLGNILRHPKGYDDLVRLAALVRDRGLPIRFTVAGRPDEGDWFRSALREAQVEEIVNYVGPVADPVAFLKAHHAYLLLSRVEGCPNALLEAMSVGLPCVATRVGDLPAIVEAGRQLQLVEVSDIAAVLARLQDFLTDWPAAVTLGQAGRKWCFEHFSTAALTAACTDLARWVETH